MAEEEQAQEKTEEPSAKRLKESREKGQVARSKDFNATVILLFTGVGFLIFGKHLSLQMAELMRQAFEFDTQILLTPTIAFERLFVLAKSGMLSLVPILMVIFLLSIGAPLLMGGWVFSGQSLQPKFSRMNPLSGLKRMVSLKGLVETVKSLLKFVVVATVSFFVLKTQVPLLLDLGNAPVEIAISSGGLIIIKSFVLISASLILIALVDVPFQLYEHNKAMKMTKG